MWHDAFKKPHDACSYNRLKLAISNKCGCFYCHEIFDASMVVKFSPEIDGREATAICPKCGIDCVLPDSSGFPMEKAFLEIQGGFWFNYVESTTPSQKYWLGQLKKAGYYDGEIE